MLLLKLFLVCLGFLAVRFRHKSLLLVGLSLVGILAIGSFLARVLAKYKLQVHTNTGQGQGYESWLETVESNRSNFWNSRSCFCSFAYYWDFKVGVAG